MRMSSILIPSKNSEAFIFINAFFGVLKLVNSIEIFVGNLTVSQASWK